MIDHDPKVYDAQCITLAVQYRISWKKGDENERQRAIKAALKLPIGFSSWGDALIEVNRIPDSVRQINALNIIEDTYDGKTSISEI